MGWPSMRFLLTPLREGRPFISQSVTALLGAFLLTPLREGRQLLAAYSSYVSNFYSRPCGRGDASVASTAAQPFSISTHAPAGGATIVFLDGHLAGRDISTHAPAGGATDVERRVMAAPELFLLTPLREGRLDEIRVLKKSDYISTHAPAGGATAIFHKSVMRFCGKLPKDDTVLCLASFGFPRRDPKAVYLAWISCANLPQKCVRQGLALKDQGTSCFHEGLASHAFVPVLV